MTSRKWLAAASALGSRTIRAKKMPRLRTWCQNSEPKSLLPPDDNKSFRRCGFRVAPHLLRFYGRFRSDARRVLTPAQGNAHQRPFSLLCRHSMFGPAPTSCMVFLLAFAGARRQVSATDFGYVMARIFMSFINPTDMLEPEQVLQQRTSMWLSYRTRHPRDGCILPNGCAISILSTGCRCPTSGLRQFTRKLYPPRPV